MINDDELRVNRNPYQRLIKKFLYLSLTRLDIAYSVHTVGQFMNNTKDLTLSENSEGIEMPKRHHGTTLPLFSLPPTD